MHVVGVLALNGVVAFDLAVPGQVFRTPTTTAGRSALYDVRVCTAPGGAETAAVFGRLTINTPWDLDQLATADTIIIPGHDLRAEPPPEVLDMLRTAADRGARIASICIGAFILAATGMLDRQRATTHWQWAADLARRHPSIDVDPSVLFVDNGALLTSAGVAAGIDLCLHLLRRDHGAALAAQTGRQIVMSPQRDGGQAQFINHKDPADTATALQPTLAWLEANLHNPLTLDDIAGQAATSVRTLTRRFREQVGTTPLQWLLRARIHHAQQLLETSDLPIERIAEQAGLGSPANLRAHFARTVGVSPQTYRTNFRARAHHPAP